MSDRFSLLSSARLAGLVCEASGEGFSGKTLHVMECSLDSLNPLCL